MELAEEIEKRNPTVKRNTIWEIIKENDLKNIPDYSVYNFRNKKHEDDYRS